jgi:hypothetical protein
MVVLPAVMVPLTPGMMELDGQGVTGYPEVGYP